jgi:hypothetical protein
VRPAIYMIASPVVTRSEGKQFSAGAREAALPGYVP